MKTATVRIKGVDIELTRLKGGELSVKFANGLRQVARDAVDGKFTAANLPKEPSGRYNSSAMLEMHAKLSLTSSAEIDAKAKIDAAAKTLVDRMQAKVTELFAPKEGGEVTKPNWQKTFAEFAGKNGIVTSTSQGKFTMKVLQNYFAKAAADDAAVTRQKNIGSEIGRLNDRLPAAQRLSGSDLATLLRATDTFYVPYPRPDAEKDWAKNNAKAKALLDAICHNLGRGAQETLDKVSQE